MTPTGSEQPRENTGETQIRSRHSAPDSAFPTDLQRVIDAWPRLTEADRRVILERIDALDTQ
jgi:hypothetical protein